VTPELAARLAALRANIEKVFYGKPEAVNSLLVALLSNGHVLIEDVPGVGKTLVARALAKSLDCSFQRIQFTADMMPSDVTGVSVYDPQRREFVFKPGPIFANVVLADEINRTSPRTQSSLLEGMNDGQVSCDGVTHPLPRPFMVLATQNPFEFEGTYPLPESELDRFLLRVSIGYPPREDELRILKDYVTMRSVEGLQAVLNVQEALSLQDLAGRARVSGPVAEYVLALVEATRRAAGVDVGISPRGGLALYRSAQAHALIQGRDYVMPDDVKAVCPAVFLHRLVCRGSRDRGRDGAAAKAVEAILSETPVPT
jgi:MoxR-like ATPase